MLKTKLDILIAHIDEYRKQIRNQKMAGNISYKEAELVDRWMRQLKIDAEEAKKVIEETDSK